MENLNINYDKTVSNATVSMISAGAILVISVLIVLLVLVIKRWKGRFIPLALGVLSYAVFGIARWFTAKMMTDRYNRTGDVLMAGTGLAIGDTVITYALSMFTFFVYAQAISANGLEKFISDMFNSGMAESDVITLYTSNVSQLIDSPAILWFLMAVSAVLDIALNIMLFMVVYGVVRKQVNYMYAYYAIIAQFVSNIMFQLYNAFSLTNIIVLFIVKLVIVGGIVLFIKQFIMKEIKYSND